MADSSQNPTLVDLVSRLDNNGDILPIAEVLSKRDPILQLIKWQECNMTEGFKHAIRTGLPTATWRKLYQGVEPSKSTTATVVDTTGNLEAYAEVDIDLANLNGNTYKWRLSEQVPFIESMGNIMAETLFYGDTDVNPERFMGLAARYSGWGDNTTKTPAARNVLNAGGSNSASDLTSIFIVNMDQFKGLYPKGSRAGLSHTDKGQITKENSDGSMYEVYRDHYKWQAGATLSDWRSCVRIANIKLSDLEDQTLSADALLKLLVKAKNRIPVQFRQNLKMFVPEEVKTALELAGIEKSTNAVKIVEAADQFKTMFFDIEILACDSISKTEAYVKKAV